MLLTLALLACRTKWEPIDSDSGVVIVDDSGVGPVDLDGDGFTAESGDCDDADATVFPEAPEVCDGRDQNCDGSVDEGVLIDVFADADGDGYGTGDPVQACEPLEGTTVNAGDCNDVSAEVFPGAAERCDGVDNDCDAEVDEEVQTTWYTDADADGFGDAASPVDTCDPGPGVVSNDDDCNDVNAKISPNADERCNDIDDDCDMVIDEEPINPKTFYTDADGDGHGDPASVVEACDLPEGASSDDDDCDDADAAVSPDAAEVCDGADNNCDGWIDDADPALSGASTWYLDYDGDGYGGTRTTDACEAPSGYVADNTDCDDKDGDTNPGALEYCDGEDDDCDSVIDEDDAADASTWYTDADGDGYGDPATAATACDAISGTVADNTDCDDTSASVYPGARETPDGTDEDCDGTVDNDTWVGSGADGALTVSSDVDICADASGSRTVADAVAYTVTGFGKALVRADSTISGIAAGDEVLIINLHGSDSANSAVGTWETAIVSSVTGKRIDLASNITGVYGETTNSDLTDQTIIVQRVPQYTDVTVASGGTLRCGDWDGVSGGVLAFRASGAVTVESGGVITASGAGYAGGATGSTTNCDSYQGESYAGEGDGEANGTCAAYNESYGLWANNYGGGGAHITGGGGNHGGGATAGDSWTGGSATAPEAGDTYGSADLSTIFFGSGGGGVWNDGSANPGPGGDGGGVIFIGADTIEVKGAGGISAAGDSTTAWASGSWTYGAGGGAGGSIYLVASSFTLASGAVDAQGGLGQSAYTRDGGDGGYGRIRLEYDEINGNAYGSGGDGTEAASACEPDPGSTAAP